MKKETKQKLFDYFDHEHRITLMSSDFNEIEEIIKPEFEAHEQAQWLFYPESKPEDKDSMYYVALKSGGYTNYYWTANSVNASWNRVLAFRPLPTTYQKGGQE